jgi:hypothetical protein
MRPSHDAASASAKHNKSVLHKTNLLLLHYNNMQNKVSITETTSKHPSPRIACRHKRPKHLLFTSAKTWSAPSQQSHVSSSISAARCRACSAEGKTIMRRASSSPRSCTSDPSAAVAVRWLLTSRTLLPASRSFKHSPAPCGASFSVARPSGPRQPCAVNQGGVLGAVTGFAAAGLISDSGITGIGQ